MRHIKEIQELFTLFDQCKEDYEGAISGKRGCKKSKADFMRDLLDIKNSVTPIRKKIFEARNADELLQESHHSTYKSSNISAIEEQNLEML